MSRRSTSALVALVLVWGCKGTPAKVTPGEGGIPSGAGLIGDAGGALISDNGGSIGGVLRGPAASVLSNNAANVISNNGAGARRYELFQEIALPADLAEVAQPADVAVIASPAMAETVETLASPAAAAVVETIDQAVLPADVAVGAVLEEVVAVPLVAEAAKAVAVPWAEPIRPAPAELVRARPAPAPAGEPLAGVKVELVDLDGKAVSDEHPVTDRQGRYAFKTLKPSRAVVFVRAAFTRNGNALTLEAAVSRDAKAQEVALDAASTLVSKKLTTLIKDDAAVERGLTADALVKLAGQFGPVMSDTAIAAALLYSPIAASHAFDDILSAAPALAVPALVKRKTSAPFPARTGKGRVNNASGVQSYPGSSASSRTSVKR